MKRILTSTTALSIALMNVQPWPAMAQVLAEDGRVLAADGTVLCEPTADLACDPANEEIVKAAQEIEARMAAEAEAEAAAAAEAEAKAAAEAEAAAAAEAEAKAAAEAEAAAAAEAEAKAAAEAEAAAAAEAEAKAAAEAAAAAEAEAKAAAEAEAAATAEAEAKAAAEAEAAAAAEAEAKAAAEAAAAAAAEEKPAEDPADEEPAAEEPAAEAPKADEAATEDAAPADEPAEAPAADAAEAPAEEAAPELPLPPTPEETEAALEQAAAETTAADGTPIDPAAGLKVEEEVIDPDAPLVDAPEVSEAEVDALSTLVAAPASDGAAAEVTTAAPSLSLATEGEAPAAIEDMPEATGAVETKVEEITAESVRSSAQEFKAPPKEVVKGKKTGLSDLEKVGLFVLGAVVVGSILNKNAPQGGQQVVSNTGDRVVVLNPDGTYSVYKDDDAGLRTPGSKVRTETYADGSTRTIVQREDGTQVVTVRDATGRVLRRAQYDRLGRELVLLDDFGAEDPVDLASLPKPRTRLTVSSKDDDAALRAALLAREAGKLGRKFSLRQIRDIPQVRALAAEVDVEAVNFASGSAAIKPNEADDLADLGALMQDMLDENPAEMFLIEGHTDATGAAAMNLALSDRRAESVAKALTEYFAIPPENMIVQGYGETELRVDTLKNEPRNRRVAVRIITPLLRTAAK